MKLEKANPEGRLDVLLFKMLDRLAVVAEERYGLKGLSDDLRPATHRMVRKLVPFKTPVPKTLLEIARDVLRNTGTPI